MAACQPSVLLNSFWADAVLSVATGILETCLQVYKDAAADLSSCSNLLASPWHGFDLITCNWSTACMPYWLFGLSKYVNLV